MRNFPVTDGRFITETDVDSAARVAVIGSRIAERLFAEQGLYPIGAADQDEQRPVQGHRRAGIEGRRRRDDGRQPG